MAKGKTFSITIPHIMVDEYDRQATELGLSRSRVVFNILLNHWNNDNPDSPIINCGYAEGKYCSRFNKDCDVPTPSTCLGHSEIK